MPFQKGQSGNPKGRPKKSREIQALAREDTLEAYNRIKNIMRSTRDQRLAIQCAQLIIERAWGKPKTAVEHTGKDGGPIETVSDTEAARLIAFALAKGAQDSEPETPEANEVTEATGQTIQ